MDKIVIEGGIPLQGEVVISGSKNAALPILAATLLAPGVHHLYNVPPLADIRTARRLLGRMGVIFPEAEPEKGGHAVPPLQGAGPVRPGCPPLHGECLPRPAETEISAEGESPLLVDTTDLTGFEAPYEMVKTMRAAVLVLGPLVARARQARVSLPGGCAIGARPINLHLKGLEAMGVRIDLNQGYVEATAPRLHGAEIYFDTTTVTGTENLLMAATLAKGTTVIKNAAMEPEVGDLARFLTAMGAEIEGIDTEVLTIHGVKELKPATYAIMPDRIEAGTYLAAAAITKGEVTLVNPPTPHLTAVMGKFTEAGLRLAAEPGRITVHAGGTLTGVDIRTLPYPGFPTDMQAQFMALMSVARGVSVITETIFENRFMHVSELRRLGADITVSGNLAVVRGRRQLKGAPVMATDLRASACLIIAALAAQDITEVHRVYHLDRGYANLVEKLAALGARIKRMPA
jgi:UDP-N-acetylglucosamine 1-carboxyvinyltransferase